MGGPTQGREPIRFVTYNFCKDRNGGLELVLRGMYQANMHLRILQETELTDGLYTCGSAEYSVVATDAPSQHLGRVAVVYRPSTHYAVEAVQQFGPNVVGLHLAMEERQCYIIGCYLTFRDTSAI